MRSMALRLLYVSSLALFLELLLVRYLAVEIMFFMFFKNFVLMAAFLGMGLGAGLGGPKHKDLSGLLHVLTAVIVLLAVFARDIGINVAFIPTGDNAFLWYHPKTMGDFATLAKVFMSCIGLTMVVAAIFLPFGQMLGRLIDNLPASSAYAWDLGGSILGVIAYSGTAFLGWSPKVGIVLVMLAAIPLIELKLVRGVAIALTLSLAGVMATAKTSPAWQPQGQLADGTRMPEFWWSPYHRVHWEPYQPQRLANGALINPGYFGFLNGHYYFDLLDFRLAAAVPPVKLNRGTASTDLTLALAHYSVPYVVEKGAKSVLLLGAGPGNDTAVAMLNGVNDITAVEIDPAVVRLGKEVHPMRPYLDPRVTVVTDDARAYMARCDRQFDIVSFGHLDSINLVSSFSSVRTDSYIYTKESMDRAFSLVKPGGTLSVSFSGQDWILVKLNALLTHASQSRPEVFQDSYMGTTTFIVQKPALPGTEMPGGTLDEVAKGMALTRLNSFVEISDDLVPTDDWPFLFLHERTPSPYHVFALLLLIGLAAVGSRVVFSEGGTFSVDWSPFWLGVGFMLIETKSITELGLLFGSTWLVTAIGILGVLGMNLIAVWLVRRKKVSAAFLYGGLLVAIVINYLLPLGILLSVPIGLRLLLAGTIVYSPLFFAGAAFAQAFAAAPAPSRVFGSNLVGAMVGGTLEYTSIMVGFKTLWILGAAVYLMAALTNRTLFKKAAGGAPEAAA